MNTSYRHKLARARRALRQADAVLIGGGAGLSAAAGLLYGGERFQTHFADFIARYGMTDMYSAGFYSFPTPEEKWAYWSRHIMVNRYDFQTGRVYGPLLKLVGDKSFFVITTNVDSLFAKAGFPLDKIFAVQGDYGKFQCAKACHPKLYDNEEAVRQMVAEQADCRVPSRLAPRCPNCGGYLEPNLRKDEFFVEDQAWHAANARHQQFLSTLPGRRVVLFELGVGYNTPSIIKYPFERITAHYPQATLIRINRDYPEVSEANRDKTIAFGRDIEEVLREI